MSKKKIRRPQQYKKPQDRTLKQWWADQSEGTRKGIIWGCVAVLAVIVLLLVYYYGIYDDGSLKVKNDAVVGLQENWLVGQRASGKNSKYYHIADVAQPEGFELVANTANTGTTQNFSYAREEDNITLNLTAVNNSVQGIVDSVYQRMTAFVGENGEITEVSDFQSVLGAGKYFSYVSSFNNEDGTTQYYKALVMYVPSNYDDTCILVSVNSSDYDKEKLAADDVMMDVAVKALDGVTLIAK